MPGSVTPSSATRNGTWSPSGHDQVFEVVLGKRCGPREDTLRCISAGVGEQTLAAHFADGNAFVQSEIDDLLQQFDVILIGRHEHLAHAALARQQQLAYGLSPFDLVAPQPARPGAGWRRWGRRSERIGPAPFRPRALAS